MTKQLFGTLQGSRLTGGQHVSTRTQTTCGTLEISAGIYTWHTGLRILMWHPANAMPRFEIRAEPWHQAPNHAQAVLLAGGPIAALDCIIKTGEPPPGWPGEGLFLRQEKTA